MIKKLISAVFAMMMISATANVQAQTEQTNDFKKNEFQFGVSAGASDYDIDEFGTYAKNNVDPKSDCMTYGGFNIQYMRNLTPRFALGPEVSIGFGGATLQNNKEDVGIMAQVDFAAMVNARFYWIQKNHFGLYSKLGVGVRAYTNKISLEDDFQQKNNIADEELEGKEDAVLAIKGCPIGVDFGGRRVRAFVETGISNQVTLSGGVKFNF